MRGVEDNEESPHFSTRSEALVWEALRTQLQPGEVVLTGLRFSDVKYGDVEADMIVLFPDAGAVVLEIKGGDVSHSNGEYFVKSGRGTRRSHPFAQARKAKHALRRFLDRQPEWKQSLLRTEWMVVLPFMDLEGDIGPEGRRELIIDRSQLPALRDLMHAQITSPLNADPYPEGEWADTALTLLLRYKSSRPQATRHRLFRAHRRGAIISSALLGVALAACLVLAVSCAGNRSPSNNPAPAISNGCNPNYAPCLPVSDDLDCTDIAEVVTVVKEDPYGLDRDGDGTACESFR